MGPIPNPFSIWLQYSCAKKIFGAPTKLHQILPCFVFNWQSLWMDSMLMHKNSLWSVGQWIDQYLESFHLVFLGCALWRVWFCYGHVLKPFNKETNCTDLLRTSLTVTCFSVWRQFQVGGRSRRRGWCTPRPPRGPPPTPRTWHVAASLELLPRMEKTKWLRKDKRKTHPHVPQVLRLLRILPVRVAVRVVLRVGVGIVTVRVLAVWILASWLVPKFARGSETPRLWSVSCWEGRV